MSEREKVNALLACVLHFKNLVFPEDSESEFKRNLALVSPSYEKRRGGEEKRKKEIW
jgi:hypothetical protein